MAAQANPASSTAAAITAACAAAGVEATTQQVATLARYLDLLAHWNTTYNLSAVRERSAMLTHHIADCVAVVPAVLRQAGAGARILDVGSGGGLPGLVIAVLMPDAEVACIDAVGKKVAFVRQAAGALQLSNLRAFHGRVEQWEAPPFDLIVSRAFASLVDFTRLTAHLLRSDGQWLAMKGRVPDDELRALAPSGSPSVAQVFHVEQLEVPALDAERCLVWMNRGGAAENGE